MRIFLDHNAGAPLRPEARDALWALLDGPPVGNPSSAHREGARARALVEAARAAVAALIGARPAEIVFTGGATEANNLALRGVAPGRLVTTVVEHASVLETARAVGRPCVEVGVDRAGRVDPDAVAAACTAGTTLVSVGLANGEVGTVTPMATLTARLGGRALVHTDAAQAAGRLPLDVGALGVDLLSLSAAKLGGLPGVGALWVRPGVALAPQATGGPQERGRRAGSENVPGVVAFGAAAAAARAELTTAPLRMAELTDRLWQGLRARIPGVVRHGDGPVLPNTLSVGFPGCTGESLLVLLDLAGVAASLGSACAAGASAPSHVLRAMGLDDAAARSALRLSVGPATTAAEIDAVVDLLPRLVAQVRGEAAA